MFWGIDHEKPTPHGLPRVRITLGAHARTFSLSMPWAEVRTLEGRHLIGGWAMSLLGLPGSGIELHEVDQLMDFLDSQYPLPKELRKDWKRGPRRWQASE